MEVSPVILKILQARGITGPEEVESFLHPSISYLSDPYGLPNLQAACERICRAVRRKEKVFLYGDGDVDGICSAFLLIGFLQAVGLEFAWYLTHRLEDYEIEESLVANLKKDGYSLLITADCGISSVAALKKAAALGIQVIVLDHHLGSGLALPDNHIYVDPSLYPVPAGLRYLCGTGVAFKLLQGLAGLIPGLKEKGVCGLLEIPGLGTVADHVALLGDNRIFAAVGLERLGATSVQGLRTYLENLGLNYRCTYRDLRLKLIPKLNTPGRFGKPEVSMNLLLSRDEKEIGSLIQEIETLDRKRYNLTSGILRQIEGGKTRPDNFYVLEDFPASLCGAVASRLAENYRMPVLIGARTGDEIKCSGRAPEWFSLYYRLLPFRDNFSSFGGHNRAVGFKFPSSFLTRMEEIWRRITSEQAEPENHRPAQTELAVAALSPDLLKEFSLLEPFGPGNPRPFFWSEPVTVQNIVRKEEKKIRFWIGVPDTLYECVLESSGPADLVVPGQEVRILYSPHVRQNGDLYRIWLEVKEAKAGLCTLPDFRHWVQT